MKNEQHRYVTFLDKENDRVEHVYLISWGTPRNVNIDQEKAIRPDMYFISDGTIDQARGICHKKVGELMEFMRWLDDNDRLALLHKFREKMCTDCGSWGEGPCYCQNDE